MCMHVYAPYAVCAYTYKTVHSITNTLYTKQHSLRKLIHTKLYNKKIFHYLNNKV